MTALLAYSYLRFSSPAQVTGDSIRRQLEARKSWLTAHPNVTLDTSLKMTDAGRSAFKRNNWDTYALAQFVAHIKSGRVEPGSFLLVENLDRLSRQDAGEATELFLSIVNKGVVIVQLSPVVMEFRRPVNIQSLMFAIVELSRGHSESAAKSERVGKAWANKQKEAGHRLVTRRLPAWVKFADGKLILDTNAAALVRRIYRLAIDGHSGRAIAKLLNARGVPVPGRKAMKEKGWREKWLSGQVKKEEVKLIPVKWSNVMVNHILTTRAVLGEYIPYKSHPEKKAGKPIPDYYPAVIDEATFYAAQSALKTRAAVGRGRRGKHVNLFAGLLRDAHDGGPLTYRHQKPFALIVPANPASAAKWTTFPAAQFEMALLSRLAELKPSDIEGDGSDAAQRVRMLSGQREEVAAVIRAWEAKMGNLAIVDTVAANLEKFTAEHKRICKELAEAQREAASPRSESLGVLKTLADLLAEDNSDELRLKVRAALRQCIESVHCLFTGTLLTRLAAVRVQFRDSDRHRDYAISLVHSRRGTKEKPRPLDVPEILDTAWRDRRDELDLRDPAAAARVEKELARLSVQIAAANSHSQ